MSDVDFPQPDIPAPVAAGTTTDAPRRSIDRHRGLPAGRAVVGALLVAVAAVATVAVQLGAASGPGPAYLVAAGPVEQGTHLAGPAAVEAAFRPAPIGAEEAVSARLIPAEALEQLVGHVVVAPLAAGDPVNRSHLVPVAAGGAHTLSFSLPRAAAVGGALTPGERVDVLATYGTGEHAYTAFVVRSVPLVAVTAPDGGALSSGGEVSVTVALSSLAHVQALGHAVNTASVFLARSGHDRDPGPAPGAYQARPQARGPQPEGQ